MDICGDVQHVFTLNDSEDKESESVTRQQNLMVHPLFSATNPRHAAALLAPKPENSIQEHEEQRRQSTQKPYLTFRRSVMTLQMHVAILSDIVAV